MNTSFVRLMLPDALAHFIWIFFDVFIQAFRLLDDTWQVGAYHDGFVFLSIAD